jgi:hypothetical protein
MTVFRTLVLGSVLGLALTAAAVPAMAQLASGPGGLGSTPGAGPTPTPQARTPDIAPPALPGAGGLTPMATGPVMQKPPAGDPTANLFAAINKGDAGAAQMAISSGANLSAQNQFGETPLDLSIALNRTNITFLLLQTRNELDEQGVGPEPVGAPWMLDNNATPGAGKSKTHAKSGTVPVSAPAIPAPSPRIAVQAGNGTPDPQAGFLGFGPKN